MTTDGRRARQRGEIPVGGDLVQPGAQRRAFLSEPADALPGGQHRLLDGVLGVGEGPLAARCCYIQGHTGNHLRKLRP